MSLRTRILLILLGVVGLYAAFDNGTLRLFAARFFGHWEEQDAAEHLDRVLVQVDEETGKLEEVARAWAGLPAVAAMATTSPASDAPSALRPELLDELALDALLVCDADGTVRWGRILDPETRAPISLARELPLGALSGSHPLRNVPRDRDLVSGLMMTSKEPMLVAAVPIQGEDGTRLDDDGSRFRRPRHGLVIVGRFLDASLRADLAASAGMEVRIARAGDDAAVDAQAAALLSSGERAAVPRVGEDGLLHVFASRNDLRTQEPLVIEGVTEREISALGRRAVDYALLSTFASALLILFVLLRLLQRFVLNPLGELTAKAVEIGRTDDTTIRTGIEREDEIGQLSREFDRMLDELALSREQVVESARLAGASEVATGVLHNVGNVLNSVNVSSNLAVRSAKALETADLERLVSVLAEHRGDLGRFVTEDEQGRHFLPFLEQLTERLGAQRASVLRELDTVASGIDHIAELVRAQQTFAVSKGVFEFADLAREVRSALDICSKALGGLHGVEVRTELEDVGSVRTDKHRLMEILVNLIQNAVQAMAKQPEGQRVLTLRLQRASASAVRIEVSDTGSGIAEDDLTRIFHHGFSTKPDGHGFGLHISANAAVEMGAELKAESPGPGRGATFTLEVPQDEPATAAAA